VGVAPGAHIINVKVGASDGAVDVSQLIAGIDWVVEHRNDPGLNIRVLNLSFGNAALQSYQSDPLAYAVENAWRKGIVVVVAAGNDGAAGTTLTNPAIDPYVIAVGADDHAGTVSRGDDSLATFSSVGNSSRAPDLLAPGRSVVSLRTPGSWIDEHYPAARMSIDGNPRLFRGSGTSQAAAVVSGAAAVVLDERPNLSPDQVKLVLQRSATRVSGAAAAQGAGLIDLRSSNLIAAGAAVRQQFPAATGTGSLELARGGSHVADPVTGEELTGERDIFGTPWNPTAWARNTRNETAWSGGDWNGVTWSGPGWGGTSWTGKTWRGITWRDDSWTGITWRTEDWTGKTWRDGAWTGITWREATWTGITWRFGNWLGAPRR
jgi:serine protease AprX